MSPDEFSGILTVGGTILGKRTPLKMRVVEDDKVDKVAAMKKTTAPPSWTACSA